VDVLTNGAVPRRYVGAGLVMVALLVLSLAGPATAVQGSRVLRVGPGERYPTPSAAAADARDGDRIEIDAAGTYDGDVVVWTQDDLTLRGVNGRPHLRAAGQSAQGKAIWVIAGKNTRVDNIEFSGAAVPDRNGAGIRQEGAGLHVTGCSFHDNENSILSGENRASDIVIERSRFVGNGAGDGFSHNLYIGTVRSLTLRGNLFVGADVGHEVKSRALRNRIVANRITDASSTASYSIDLPNGGDSVVAGNTIIQGPNSENSTIVTYGAEGLVNPSTRLWLVNNTIVNRKPTGTFVVIADGTDAQLWNNLFVGRGTLVAGEVERRANLRVGLRGFVDPERDDFRLRAGSPARNAGDAPPRPVRARLEYRHPSRFARRATDAVIDIGAFEYVDWSIRAGEVG
jgi:hypothetical protein